MWQQTVPDLWWQRSEVLSAKLLRVRLITSVGVSAKCSTTATGVSDEPTVVSQVTRGVAGQRPVDENRSFEHDALPHRKPLQLAEHRRDVIAIA